MRIRLISVGKLKEEYLKDAIGYYSKEIKKHYFFEEIEINDEKAPENYSRIEIEKVKEKEGKNILSYIPDLAYVIALDIMGNTYTSKEMIKQFEKINSMGYKEIIFIIGGSNGLSSEVLKRANEKISFSPMTFPHQLMRAILMEQLGRCLKV